MQSNPFASLPGNLGTRAAALVKAREAAGYNVHFINDRGQRDRFSFSDADRANRFRERLMSEGRVVFASEAEAAQWNA